MSSNAAVGGAGRSCSEAHGSSSSSQFGDTSTALPRLRCSPPSYSDQASGDQLSSAPAESALHGSTISSIHSALVVSPESRCSQGSTTSSITGAASDVPLI